jgi:hypothetical protein
MLRFMEKIRKVAQLHLLLFPEQDYLMSFADDWNQSDYQLELA